MHRFKVFSLSIHLVGWLLFLAFPLVFFTNSYEGNLWLLLKHPAYWLFCFTYIALFYINSEWLMPRLFLKKRYVAYGTLSFILMLLVFFLQPFDRLVRSRETGGALMWRYPGQASFVPPTVAFKLDRAGKLNSNNNTRTDLQASPLSTVSTQPRHVDSGSLFVFIIMMAIGTAAKVVEQWRLTEQRATQAEADKASAELMLLKAQINPHFLFNTLNNIYTLAVTQNDNTANSIMKLSNIMRYVTDDSAADFVALQNEIDRIGDYIELHRLRTGANTNVNFTVIGDTSRKSIPPLIMMNFIENVYKHGISKNKPVDINIKIEVSENSVSFFCQNPVFKKPEEGDRTGIGIVNAKKRLEHLYPNKHTFSITNDGELFTVNLVLPA